MNDFLKMDIFFAVTTVVTIVLGIGIAIVLWRLERILKNVEHISKQIAIESDNVRQDLVELRSNIRQGKGRLMSLLRFLDVFPKKSSRKS
ncbi:MAG: hypothetical protein WC030_03895 [Candidatus Paceibacterota bacterium]